ncbi:hypothetical protein E2C01_066366 [Portunus trituberculatus]|uniref:Uncharacterized protein n=1 Tax=Portunus trituberculatus TaxID=210409 RepID=A0A5B7HPK4_PORTR|nr:hypothetical protein [Portunus trituberculatus]
MFSFILTLPYFSSSSLHGSYQTFNSFSPANVKKSLCNQHFLHFFHPNQLFRPSFTSLEVLVFLSTNPNTPSSSQRRVWHREEESEAERADVP